MERAGGSSADGMQHYGAGVHTVDPHALRDGARAQNDRDGGAFNVCAEGQTAVVAVQLLHSEGRASGPLRRRSAALEKSSEVGMMAMECGARSAQ